MFWGLIMEPNKRYTQIVEKSFHVSMASLDASTAGTYSGAVQVMLNYENRNYLLCTLQTGSTLQVPLDLNFQEGTKIAFTSNGSGHVHLTGYLVPEEDELDLDDELEEEEEDEIPELVDKQPKRKAVDTIKQSLNNAKRLKQEAEEESSDEDDEDDDFDMDGSESDEFKDESLDDLNKEDGEDDDDDEDDEDEEDEDEEEEEVVAEPPQKKNKKNKQKEQQQQQQQQQGKKQDKQKLVNGKETKKDQKQQDKQTKKNKGEQQQQQQQQQQQIQNNKQEQKKRVIEGGVQVEDLKVGTGAPAKSGKFVSVYYIGRLKNGKKFDSCNQGDGFKFRLGKNEVIRGWDVGIAGMKIGGKRRLTVPPALAYGAKGSPPVIPPNSALIFEVELKSVH